MAATPDQIHVLHVDDEPGFAEMAAEFIHRQDERLAVETATNAAEALDRLGENRIQCIVSDFDMPGQNGIELLEAVREEYPDLPFILFTGKGSEEVAADAISAGVTDYIQKGSGSSQYAVLAQRITNAVQAAMTERELQMTLSRVTDAIFTLDPEWRITYVNAGAEAVMGPKEKLLGESLWEQFPEATEGVVWENYHDAMETQEPRSFTIYYDPLEVWVSVTAYPSETGLTVYFRDITEQKERDQQLQRERDRFRAVFDKASDAIVIADDDGRYVDANPQATELFGLDREDLLGRSIAEFAHEDYDFEAAWEQFQQSDRERGTFPLVRADGEHRTVEYAASTEVVEGQHLSVLRDVTDRREREERLQQTTARLEALFENSPDMIDVLDPDGRLLDVNSRFCSELGYTEEELLGRPIWEIDVQVTKDAVHSLLADFEVNERRKFEGTYERKDGSRVPVEVHLLRLNIEGSDRFLAISRDITERKAYERSLLRQNERLDEFAGLVSHDIRNPLNVAQGHLELAREDCDSEHFEAVEQALDRIDGLIDNLLELARLGQQVRDTEPIDLVELAEECWQNVATGEATLVTANAPSIQGDRSRIQQVLENLIPNAVEHGGEGVTITVGGIDGGFYVEDDGAGIPEDVRDDVFESGYSTTEEGTGFGLSIVEQIVAAHGWTVDLTTGADGGARFEFSGVRHGGIHSQNPSQRPSRRRGS